ncbi:MAG: molybdopterin-dependent oxidoreductase [Deltaproteobacteria bacterium]|nr:molybdopterin-dependent oxidoreductase [Deltaproteobacteria bacterium]
MGKEIKHSLCFWCKPRCRLRVEVEDNRLVRIQGSPIKACPRKYCPDLERFYHPDRLTYPLKRIGDKGQNRWQRITWDEALNEIASKLADLKGRHGAETLAVSRGTSRTHEEFTMRFLNLFGSPNQCGQAQICHGNSAVVATALFGWWPYWMNTEKLANTKCVMLIGRNPPHTHQTIWEGILKAKENGTKLIVIDPRRCESAEEADLWLQVRPGTDAALLLGMIDVIIREGLYDREFVTKWCHGFDELAERARQYPLRKVSEITWVPEEQIRAAARMFATETPSCAMEGMGVAHQPNSYSPIAARHILSAIVGNVDVPGGEELMGPAPFVTELEMEMAGALSAEQRAKVLGKQFRLYTSPGYELIQSNVERVWGKRCDMFGYNHIATAPSVYKAIATSDPYPVRALITVASNPMVTIPDTKLVYKALKSLDLYVVTDYFMTPSAALADYVLPSASWLERPHLWNYHNTTPVLRAGEAALPPSIPGKYDRRTDFDFWRGLGMRLGQAEHWPWESLEETYDYRLKPMGMTFQDLVEKGKWAPETYEYRKYEKTGFGTPTGKIELWSTVMETLGYDPLPSYKEPPESPTRTPELSDQYPLILITGGRFHPFFHSEHRQVETLRKYYPWATMQIHPDTAAEVGVADDDWVWIETQHGRVMQKVQVFEGVDRRVVHAQHGWWYPEMPAEEPWLHGVWISNINVCTSGDESTCDEALGSWPLRTFQCRVYKVQSFGQDGKTVPPIPG